MSEKSECTYGSLNSKSSYEKLRDKYEAEALEFAIREIDHADYMQSIKSAEDLIKSIG